MTTENTNTLPGLNTVRHENSRKKMATNYEKAGGVGVPLREKLVAIVHSLGQPYIRFHS